MWPMISDKAFIVVFEQLHLLIFGPDLTTLAFKLYCMSYRTKIGQNSSETGKNKAKFLDQNLIQYDGSWDKNDILYCPR